jgi:hypothetical protein
MALLLLAANVTIQQYRSATKDVAPCPTRAKHMSKAERRFCVVVVLAAILPSAAQTNYQIVNVTDGGTISGTVKWSGPVPKAVTLPITKDSQICDPDSEKKVDLERLVIGPDGGVANTVVYLKNISSGKAFDFPQARRSLDQKHCRYEPHILLVPAHENLEMKSSDATLHTIHMEGAATYNLPFPFVDKPVSRSMNTPGVVNLRCNGGHTWMNAEVMVAPHPYYAVTDLNGHFTLTDVPAGQYELVAWHEGWQVLKQETAYDVLTEAKVGRAIFSLPRTWEKPVKVDPHGTDSVNFVISDK